VKGREELRISNSQETEAIRQAQRGDANAFELLYRSHSPRVFALCLRMLKNNAEAEDLTQETFLTVFRAIRTFRGHSAFSSWLHRVTMNCVLMRIRKKALATISLEEIIKRSEETGSPRRELSHFDLRLKGLIDRISIEKAIAQLPTGLRGIFVLYDLFGCEHKEIADILDCSAGTSKSQLHKARRRLRELLPRCQPSGTLNEVQSGCHAAL
jgi:RNA polymerase sigma-70 factor (ECF subfamily)